METEDSGFIRAIRDTPDDETTRLVYTDWLDDRGGPRGEYLRTEAAWVALQPTDEQYRPLFRLVSQLAKRIDPEWFATVSRVAQTTRGAWQRVAHLWEPDPTESTAQANERAEAVHELDTTFSHFVGREATTRRFCLPVDYWAFVAAVGGGWWLNGGDWNRIYSINRAAERTTSDARVFGDEPGEHLELWMHVAISGDMHHYFLCCDLDSPRFGTIAEGEDYHPWMSFGSAGLTPRSDNFPQFLTDCWLTGSEAIDFA